MWIVNTIESGHCDELSTFSDVLSTAAAGVGTGAGAGAGAGGEGIDVVAYTNVSLVYSITTHQGHFILIKRRISQISLPHIFSVKLATLYN